MSDAWIPVFYALIAAVAAGFGAWVSAKYAVKTTDKKVDVVLSQTAIQAAELADVKKALCVALETGRAEGIDIERRRRAAAVLDTAKCAAEDVIDTAKIAAKEVLVVAEKKEKHKD